MHFLRPASLRGRVVLGMLALLLLLLILLFSTVDALLAARLNGDLRTRLTDRVALAAQLDGAMSSQQLVDRLRGEGVTAQLCTPSGSNGSAASDSSGSPAAALGSSDSSSRCVTAATSPPAPGAKQPVKAPADGGQVAKPKAVPPAAPSNIAQSGPVLYVRTVLPSTGQTLTLSVDSSEVGATMRHLIVLEVIGGLAALLLAALLLGRVVAAALRPLDRMTALAARIAGGDRGQRLRTGRSDTELGRTATAFDAMLDELEQALSTAASADQRLRNFIGDITHELRTPLTGLTATTETLLREEPARSEREQAYVTMVRETQRASRLVDDLLTLTRLDTGMTMQTERVDLAAVAGQEIDRLANLAPGLDIRLELASGTDKPVVVVGDPIRLGQVIGNLLNNARTAAGPLGTIRVELYGETAWWHVDVCDNGPGVDPPDRERIFERLVRLDVSRSRDGGGSGLGLPIARMLARAHGGDLTYADKAIGDPANGSSGARFRVSLPRQDLPSRA